MLVEASLEFGISLSARLDILLSGDYRCDAPSLTKFCFCSEDGHFPRRSGKSRADILEIFLCWCSKGLNDRFLVATVPGRP